MALVVPHSSILTFAQLEMVEDEEMEQEEPAESVAPEKAKYKTKSKSKAKAGESSQRATCLSNGKCMRITGFPNGVLAGLLDLMRAALSDDPIHNRYSLKDCEQTVSYIRFSVKLHSMQIPLVPLRHTHEVHPQRYLMNVVNLNKVHKTRNPMPSEVFKHSRKKQLL